jgi:hypothetical protein
MKRRDFLTTGLAAGAVLGARSSAAEKKKKDKAPETTPEPAADARFTTITYNARWLKGWGSRMQYKWRAEKIEQQFPERLALEFALYNPDFITLVEAPPEEDVALIANRLGMQYFHYPVGAPCALLSRCRIIKSEDKPGVNGGPCPEALRDRSFARTELETGIGPLVLYSLHTTASNREKRFAEIRAAAEVIRADLKPGRSVLLQGDLNHAPDWPEYDIWVAAGLKDAFEMKCTGVSKTHGTAQPMLRIDYVWLYGPVTGRLVGIRALFEGAFRSNGKDPSAFTFSDHLPVMAQFA